MKNIRVITMKNIQVKRWRTFKILNKIDLAKDNLLSVQNIEICHKDQSPDQSIDKSENNDLSVDKQECTDQSIDKSEYSDLSVDKPDNSVDTDQSIDKSEYTDYSVDYVIFTKYLDSATVKSRNMED